MDKSNHFMPLIAEYHKGGEIDTERLFVRLVDSNRAVAPSVDDLDETYDAQSGLRVLSASGGADECWLSATPPQRGTYESWRYAHNDDVLFAWRQVGDEHAGAMAHIAYAEFMQLMSQLRFTQLVRAWHYIPDLNADEEGVTRYAAFCRGRRIALADSLQQGFCAATVIGTHSKKGLLLFVATREAGVPIENPRQTNAHDYPLPAADKPWFARAMYVRGHLFVSGTASIVGSQSVNAGDTAAEFKEIVRNMEDLLKEAGTHGARFSLKDMASLKVYLSDPAALETTRAQIEDLSLSCPVIFFNGDICRAELTVEAEALFLPP